MNAQEIREMTDDEIDAKIETTAQELFNLRFRGSFEETDSALIRRLRRDIARMKTIRHERELAAAGDQDG
ncbi:MAG: 50S ribosomal protein L29 [Acidobacteriota bacterium]|nr:50S ribosomal protein L29 [Acidobacteriota bacterium]